MVMLHIIYPPVKPAVIKIMALVYLHKNRPRPGQADWFCAKDIALKKEA